MTQLAIDGASALEVGLVELTDFIVATDGGGPAGEFVDDIDQFRTRELKALEPPP